MVIRKGQMKIQQMAFMLIAVTLFLILAGMFILMLRFSSLKGSAEMLQEKEALLLASKITASPEFSCESAFGEPLANCVDLDKVMALKSRIQNYRDFWGVSGLDIRKTYPSDSSEECTLDNYPNCGRITLVSASGGTSISNFASLCRKEKGDFSYDKCELGRIIVNYGD